MVSELDAVGVCPDVHIDPLVIDPYLQILMGRNIPDEGPPESDITFLEPSAFEEEDPHHVVDIGTVEESISTPERGDISYEKLKESGVGFDPVSAIFCIQNIVRFSQAFFLILGLFELIDNYLYIVRQCIGYLGFWEEIEGHVWRVICYLLCSFSWE